MNLGKESETLEFKKSTSELKEGMISIASILNKHGVGTLYFGVKPNGDVVGQTVAESSIRDVSRAVYENIRPQIFPVIEEVVLEGKHLIKVEFSGNNTPYSSAGRYYLRTADEDRVVSPEELKSFFVANEYREKWEKTSSNDLATQIDKKAVKAFWQNAISVGRIPMGRYTCPIILERYGLVNGDYLNNAGKYLFGNSKPVTLKAAIFATDDKLTFLDMKLFEDNIYNLLGNAEDYILRNIRWRAEIVGTERSDIPEIPVAVIREILANGFAHAVYNGPTNHEICIHPSMITIYSPGEYASAYKPDEYMKGNYESMIRNATIAKILYLNKSIERLESGYKRIEALCKDAGVRFSYENNKLGFKFILYRSKIQMDIQTADLNKTEKSVLALLMQNPDSSRGEIAERISRTVRTVQRVLVSLKDKGYIQRIGSKQEPKWEVLRVLA